MTIEPGISVGSFRVISRGLTVCFNVPREIATAAENGCRVAWAKIERHADCAIGAVRLERIERALARLSAIDNANFF